MWCFLQVALSAEVPDVAVVPDRVRPARKDVALVIGNEDYSSLPDAVDAVADADLVYTVLRGVVGVPGENILRERNLTTEALTNSIARAAEKVRAGGRLWVYFAGHGAAGGRGQRLLLGTDAAADADALAGVSVAWLSNTVGATEADQVMVVLDAGFGGLGRGGGELYPGKRFVVAPEGPAADSGVTVWMGVSGAESPGLFVEAGHGVFTWSVVGALRGWADGQAGTPADRVVQLAEAQEYVVRLVRTLAGTGQRPTRDPRGALAEWPLARALEAEPDAHVLEVLAQAARAERVRVQQEALYARARVDWAAVESQLSVAKPPLLPGAPAEVAVRTFLARYDGATVIVDGQELAVVVPQTVDARAILDRIARNIPKATRKTRKKLKPPPAPPPNPVVAACLDLAPLEPPASHGVLDETQLACLEARLAVEPAQTVRDKVSRVLLVNADARGDEVEWARLAARHLETIDRSDPDLCLKYALVLSRGDIEDAPDVLRWAEIGLENKFVWVGETFIHRVYALHRLRAEAAARLWEAGELDRLEDPSEVDAEELILRRGQARDFAREWLDYARGSRQPAERPLELCRSAAGTAEFCAP